jgi:hypothetical protein
MGERETFKFEHRGCTLTLIATKLDGEWRCHFELTFPADAHQPKLWRDEIPCASAQVAFEKSKAMGVSGDCQATIRTCNRDPHPSQTHKH